MNSNFLNMFDMVANSSKNISITSYYIAMFNPYNVSRLSPKVLSLFNNYKCISNGAWNIFRHHIYSTHAN